MVSSIRDMANSGGITQKIDRSLRQENQNLQCLPDSREGIVRPRQRKLVSVNTAQNSSLAWPPCRSASATTGSSNLRSEQHIRTVRQSRLDASTTVSKLLSTIEHNTDYGTIQEKRVAHDKRAKSPPLLHRPARTSKNSFRLPSLTSETSTSDTEESQDSMSDFIVSDSASEGELRKPPPSMRKKAQRPLERPLRNSRPIVSDDDEEDSSSSRAKHDSTGSIEPRNELSQDGLPILYPDLPTGHISRATPSLDTSKDVVKKSKNQAPREALTLRTPPTSPSKPRLQSPSKSRTQIPQSPHRRSIDAFWTQDVINEWNDSYSPQKAQKIKIFPPTDNELMPAVSPLRSSLFSPNPENKATIQAKRNFDGKKHGIAADFLADLDRVVTDGQLSALSAATGGVKIIWSKTLNSTAGRAKWQREAIRTTDPTSSTAKRITKYNHHASIELAVKVIDDEDRLLNVVAHEFCHLANFMVSNVKDQPHGKSFQQWAAKVTSKFPHKNIHVTTKHSYKIDYKYIWNCTDCGIEYKRHSKSVDPLRHACSVCKGKLVQTKPAPRSNANSHGKQGTRSNAYQDFVKKWYATVQQEHPDWKMKDVTSELARRYKAGKEGNGAATQVDLTADKENLSGAHVDVVVLSSDNEDSAGDTDSLDRQLNGLILS